MKNIDTYIYTYIHRIHRYIDTHMYIHICMHYTYINILAQCPPDDPHCFMFAHVMMSNTQ